MIYRKEKKPMKEKVILAYSGGLDTTAIIPRAAAIKIALFFIIVSSSFFDSPFGGYFYHQPELCALSGFSCRSFWKFS